MYGKIYGCIIANVRLYVCGFEFINGTELRETAAKIQEREDLPLTIK